MPEGKLREKGKKESQVFTSVADNPRHMFSALHLPAFARCMQPVRLVCLGYPKHW